MTLDDLDEIVEDLTNSTDEINSIVRNVLISFRLADGRQIIRPERIDVGEILETLSRDFGRRVSEKNQSISMYIQEEVPAVSGDRAAGVSSMIDLSCLICT
jgi:K+-sensing histidine kinase KdpD